MTELYLILYCMQERNKNNRRAVDLWVKHLYNQCSHGDAGLFPKAQVRSVWPQAITGLVPTTPEDGTW